MEHNPKNVISLKNTKPQTITSNRGKTVTIMASGNAVGSRIVNTFFSGIRWNDELLKGCCPGANDTVTESGWSNSTVFLQCMNTHFLKHAPSICFPLLVLFDGHKSHVNMTLRDWSKEHNVIFVYYHPTPLMSHKPWTLAASDL